MRNYLLKNISFSIVDIETTGLSPFRGERICEIAVLKIRNSRTTAEFQSLVNPETRISRGASFINGITDDMVIGAPKFRDISSRVLRLLKGSVIVCHNASFDLGFIRSQLGELKAPVIKNPVIDTLKLARRHYRFPSNSLGNIARELCIPANNAHRAMGDVITTRKVFDCFLEDFQSCFLF